MQVVGGAGRDDRGGAYFLDSAAAITFGECFGVHKQQCSREFPPYSRKILAAFPNPKLALLGRGVGARFAKSAVPRNEDEDYVQLAEGIIQRAIVEAKEVICDEAEIFHATNDVEKFRATNHRC